MLCILGFWFVCIFWFGSFLLCVGFECFCWWLGWFFGLLLGICVVWWCVGVFLWFIGWVSGFINFWVWSVWWVYGDDWLGCFWGLVGFCMCWWLFWVVLIGMDFNCVCWGMWSFFFDWMGCSCGWIRCFWCWGGGLCLFWLLVWV